MVFYMYYTYKIMDSSYFDGGIAYSYTEYIKQKSMRRKSDAANAQYSYEDVEKLKVPNWLYFSSF